MLSLKCFNYKKQVDGFTLLELMITLSVISILSAIAIPNYLKMRSRAALRVAALNLVSNMKMAKYNAITDNSTWAIQFDTDASTYRILNDRGPDDKWDTEDDRVYTEVSLTPSGTSFGSGYGKRPGATSNPVDGVVFSNKRVIFNSDGKSISGTVYIKNNRDDTVAVGSTSFDGTIRAWQNNGSGWKIIKSN